MGRPSRELLLRGPGTDPGARRASSSAQDKGEGGEDERVGKQPPKVRPFESRGAPPPALTAGLGDAAATAAWSLGDDIASMSMGASLAAGASPFLESFWGGREEREALSLALFHARPAAEGGPHETKGGRCASCGVTDHT